MPKDIALPNPPKPVFARLANSLDLVYGRADGTDEVCDELLDRERPVVAYEGRDACIADEVRYIWIPVRSKGNISSDVE